MSTRLIFPRTEEIEMLEGETILQGAIRANVPLTHVCGGVARCSTCRVQVMEGLENCIPHNAEEREVASNSTTLAMEVSPSTFSTTAMSPKATF
jgi:ferredoxin